MKDQNILIVDDEKNIRLTMSQSLEALGMPVHTAVNGEEALQKLQHSGFSLVFLDLKMPGMDGMEVLHRINESWPATRVIVITAHGTVATAVEAMKSGAVDFIQKPFSPSEIRELARRVLAREQLDEESAIEPGDLIELAKRHITNRSFEEARQTVRKAIAADPGLPEAYNLLGVLLEIKGDWVEAQKFYRAALDIDPTYKPAAANLERTTTRNRFGRIDIGAADRQAGGGQAGTEANESEGSEDNHEK